MKDYTEISSKKILAVRKELGISCREISSRFGSSTSDWHKYEKGINKMPMDLFLALCREYKWSLDEIFQIEETANLSTEEKKIINLCRKMTAKQLIYFIGLMEFPDEFYKKMFDDVNNDS